MKTDPALTNLGYLTLHQLHDVVAEECTVVQSVDLLTLYLMQNAGIIVELPRVAFEMGISSENENADDSTLEKWILPMSRNVHDKNFSGTEYVEKLMSLQYECLDISEQVVSNVITASDFRNEHASLKFLEADDDVELSNILKSGNLFLFYVVASMKKGSLLEMQMETEISTLQLAQATMLERIETLLNILSVRRRDMSSRIAADIDLDNPWMTLKHGVFPDKHGNYEVYYRTKLDEKLKDVAGVKEKDFFIGVYTSKGEATDAFRKFTGRAAPAFPWRNKYT